MHLPFTALADDDILRIAIGGKYYSTTLVDLIAPLCAAAMEAGKKFVLVDFRMVEGRLEELDRYHGGVEFARVFARKFKVAALERAERINYFGENAAVNRGGDIRVFDSEEKALAWLMAQRGSSR